MKIISIQNQKYKQLEFNEQIPRQSFFIFKEEFQTYQLNDRLNLRPVRSSVGKYPSDFSNCIFYVLVEENELLPESLFNISRL